MKYNNRTWLLEKILGEGGHDAINKYFSEKAAAEEHRRREAERKRREAERKRKEAEARRKAEETRKTYEKYTLKKTLQGHTGVRALAIYKDTIISGSYKEIKLWTLEGECIRTLTLERDSHWVYALAVHKIRKGVYNHNHAISVLREALRIKDKRLVSHKTYKYDYHKKAMVYIGTAYRVI